MNSSSAPGLDWQRHVDTIHIAGFVQLYRIKHRIVPGSAQTGDDDWGEMRQYVCGTLAHTPELGGEWGKLADSDFRSRVVAWVAGQPAPLDR